MKALIVGDDEVGPIRQEMASFGLREIQHWNGRTPGSARQSIPPGILRKL